MCSLDGRCWTDVYVGTAAPSIFDVAPLETRFDATPPLMLMPTGPKRAAGNDVASLDR